MKTSKFKIGDRVVFYKASVPIKGFGEYTYLLNKTATVVNVIQYGLNKFRLNVAFDDPDIASMHPGDSYNWHEIRFKKIDLGRFCRNHK